MYENEVPFTPHLVDLGNPAAREELRMATRPWAAGEHFSMADCSAAPALYYTHRLMPLSGEYPRVYAYLERLMARPSYARTLHEAEPYMAHLPA